MTNAFSEAMAQFEQLSDLEPARKPVHVAHVHMHHEHRGAQIHDLDTILRFIEAGRATFTLVSCKTGDRFTYKVSKPEDGNVHFVALLTGPDNTSNYNYIGYIRRGVFFYGIKSKISHEAPSVRAFEWFHKRLTAKGDLSQLEFWHMGHCGRCGRELTVPESIASGFGPECINKI